MALFLAACAPGGDELSLKGDGASLPPAVAGNTLARVEVVLPPEPRFVLRATVPLPKNLHGGASGNARLGFALDGGDAIPAQIETVARYPRQQDGASVIELVARVDRPDGVAAGQRHVYSVVVLDAPVTPPQVPADPAGALVQGPLDLPGAVNTLLGNPANVSLFARDAFGHEYRFDVLGPQSHKKVLKHGYHHAQIKSSGELRPVSPVSGSTGTLPHLFGAQTYVSTLSGEPVVLLDLRVHNAHTGGSGTTALREVYFDELVLRVPSGFTVLQDFPDPKSGVTSSGGGWTRFSVVTPEAGGKLHVLPRQSQFHRRLAIAPTAVADRARRLLDGEGLGFVQRGKDGSGADLYSWWAIGTTRWFPQSFQLPSLAHVNVQTLRDQFTNELTKIQGAVQSGASLGAYPIETARLGWAHPYGTSYGGMTGGVGIHLFDGVRLVEARALEGRRLARLVHRLNTDRQPNALFRPDGEPIRLEDWLVNSSGLVPHVPFSFYMKPLGSADPFGLASAPTFQIQAVVAQGRTPDYQSAIASYQPHDLQHLIRYTANAKVLAWLENDSLAKDDLLLQAELFRLSYHPYSNNASGYTDGTGMRADQVFVSQFPGRGADIGRGEGWGFDVASAAYALGSPAMRDAFYPWFQEGAVLLNDAVVPCTGHLLARVNSKMLDGKYRASQTYEDAILYNSVRGIVESVFRGRSAPHTSMLEQVLGSGFTSFIGPLKWASAPYVGPRHIYAIGPTNPSLGIWCSAASQPADGSTQTVDNYQSWSMFGYAYDATKNGIYLTRASQMVAGDLLTEMLAAGAANVENRAALLAVVQRLNGYL
jgi:hypothetical protein